MSISQYTYSPHNLKIWLSFSLSLAFNSFLLYGQDCFQGWADDAYPIKLCLDFEDEKNVFGEYTYIQSDLSFELQGFRTGDSIRLLEFDQKGQVSGFVFLVLGESSMYGHWRNTDHQIQSAFELFDPKKSFITDNCGSNKWIKVLEYQRKDKVYELPIIRSAQHIAYGNIHASDGFDLAFRGHCKNRPCTEINVEKGADMRLPERVEFTDGKNALLHFQNERRPLKAKVKQIYSMECFSEISYTTSLDIQYPVVDEIFRKELEKQILKWSREVNHKVNMHLGVPGDIPEFRWSLRYYGWLEIDIAEQTFLSGYLELIGPNGGIDGISFNYNIEDQEFVELETYLRKDENFEQLVQKEYGARYQIDSWKYATIRPDGITLRTMFDPVYGRKEYFLSFDEYGKYMRGALIKLANAK